VLPLLIWKSFSVPSFFSWTLPLPCHPLTTLPRRKYSTRCALCPFSLHFITVWLDVEKNNICWLLFSIASPATPFPAPARLSTRLLSLIASLSHRLFHTSLIPSPFNPCCTSQLAAVRRNIFLIKLFRSNTLAWKGRRLQNLLYCVPLTKTAFPLFIRLDFSAATLGCYIQAWQLRLKLVLPSLNENPRHHTCRITTRSRKQSACQQLHMYSCLHSRPTYCQLASKIDIDLSSH
jgi:hypothetical protein